MQLENRNRPPADIGYAFAGCGKVYRSHSRSHLGLQYLSGSLYSFFPVLWSHYFVRALQLHFNPDAKFFVYNGI